VLGQASFRRAHRIEKLCRECGFCKHMISCLNEAECVGCGACVDACPYAAKILEEEHVKRPFTTIRVDGEPFQVPEGITILRALELLGHRVSRIPDSGAIYAPCRSGGCWSCAVVVNGELRPSCVTPLRAGDVIETRSGAVESLVPLRCVSGFQGHSVGGVGTPYWLKSSSWLSSYIETACFAHGCILRCPTCQNWEVTYSSVVPPLTPRKAAEKMTKARERYGVDRMAISGGECTLNPRWLLQYMAELKNMNSDKRARLHVDTNAVVLTPEFVDALVRAGMTDIGPDIKGLRLDTFLRITGLADRELAENLLKNEWRAVEYLLKTYWNELFIGIGIPYNSKLMSLDEVSRIGDRIASYEPRVQVCVLDYRPEFRRQDIVKPTYDEMAHVKKTLEDTGLECVICQTERGHIGPSLKDHICDEVSMT